MRVAWVAVGGGGVVKRVTRVFTREIKSEILTVHVMEARQRPMHALLLLTYVARAMVVVHSAALG